MSEQPHDQDSRALLCATFQSLTRLAVEQRYPDQYSLGGYIAASMHATQRPEDFTVERIKEAARYVAANYPKWWRQYADLGIAFEGHTPAQLVIDEARPKAEP